MSAPAGTPSTWFSGKSSPEGPKPGIDSGLVKLCVFIVVGLLNPVAAVIGMAGYLAFAVGRVSWKWVSTVAAVYGIVLVLSGQFANATRTYIRPVTEFLYNAKNGGPEAIRAAIPAWLLDQAPLGILIGLTGASVYASWRWMRRPTWERIEQGPSPWQLLHRIKVSRDIAADKHGPKKGGVTLGVSRYGKKITQPDIEGAAHSLVLGGAGRGKTTTMLMGMRDVIRQGRGLVVLDLKGSKDVPEQLAAWAARYDRKFLHWSIHDPRLRYAGPGGAPAFYDAIGRGDPSRRKDLIVGSQKWDVEYYKTVIEHYLQNAFTVMDLVPPQDGADAITDLARMLDIRHLSARANQLNEAEHADVLAAIHHVRTGMGEQEKSGIRNMYARLQTLIQSTAGAWLRRDPSGERNINLRQVADEGHVVCFSLDSGNYEATSAMVAGLIVQDLKTLSSDLRHTPARRGPLHVYLDEFSAAGHDNILGLLARARDARMPVTLSTQALADLRRANPDFLAQVLGIISCFMIHGTNTHDDATMLAGLTGEHSVFRKRLDVEMTSGVLPGGLGVGAATGGGSVVEEMEFRVTPDKIQDLKQGHCVYVARSPEFRLVNPVRVIQENPTKVGGSNPTAPGSDLDSSAAPTQQTSTTGREPGTPHGKFGAITGTLGRVTEMIRSRTHRSTPANPPHGPEQAPGPDTPEAWQDGMSTPMPHRLAPPAPFPAGDDPVPQRAAGTHPATADPHPGHSAPAVQTHGPAGVPDPFAAHAQAAAGVRTDTSTSQAHVPPGKPDWANDDPARTVPVSTRPVNGSGTGRRNRPTPTTARSNQETQQPAQVNGTDHQPRRAPQPGTDHPPVRRDRPTPQSTTPDDEWALSLTGKPYTADRTRNVIPGNTLVTETRPSVFAVPDMGDLSWSDSDPDRGAPMAAAPSRGGTPAQPAAPAVQEPSPPPAKAAGKKRGGSTKRTAGLRQPGRGAGSRADTSARARGRKDPGQGKPPTRNKPSSEQAKPQGAPTGQDLPLFDMPDPAPGSRPSTEKTRTGVQAVLDESEWSD